MQCVLRYSGCLKYRCYLFDMENNMRKYIPLVLFIFSWPALSADIHG
ncbi:TPA: nuclease [Escherichia coli]|nr:nuclease [Escherichia coli]EFJ2779180.1 nuclease [Escherichia coli]EFJ3240525.1 nuclease [Escherichia coli]EGO4298747.1 nuclease [Escherichia coli]EGO4766224.1 nuclease [Escherichia coli]